MPKPVFLYANGTAFFAEIVGVSIGATPGGAGIFPWEGKKFVWDFIYQDPFPYLLNEQVWDSRKIDYPASIFPMGGGSINVGVERTVNAILATAPGTPFALGGYSQGAAVMSYVYREIQSGSLSSRQADFMGATLFGNPMRQMDFTAPECPYSGAWDVPGSTTGGGGCFPDRLTNCEYGKWREYTNVDEVVSGTGTSPMGAGFRAAVGWLTGMLDPWQTLQGLMQTNWIAGLQAALAIGDFGHVKYPLFPQLTSRTQAVSPTAKTVYQSAYDFLEDVVSEESVTPILPLTHPSINKPWTISRPIPSA